MDAIEPNVAALAWFGLLWGAACLAFLVLAGMFPLSERPEALHGPSGVALILANVLLLAALSAGAAWFGYRQLRWTSLVVLGGLIVLFAPGLFQLLPQRWRDAQAGLALLLAGQALALALLVFVSGSRWFPFT